MRISLPYHEADIQLACDIARAVQKCGHVALLAGGVVRDIIRAALGQTNATRPFKDVDLCCSMPVVCMSALDVDAEMKPTGEQYGTLTFVRGNAVVEVTQCRVDFGDLNGPTNNRKEVFPTFCADPVAGPRMDVERRDLTINGLLADPFTGEVLDYVGGVTDIVNQEVRFIGSATARCQEDALRLLRATRFAARYGYAMDPSVFDAATDVVVQSRLQNLSAERVRDEFLAIMSVASSHNAAWALTMLHEFGVLDYWFPELAALVDVPQNSYHSHDVWGHTLLAVEHSDPDLYCRLFALFHDLGKPATAEFVDSHYGWSFHGHPQVSAEILDGLLERLKFGATHTNGYDFNTAQLRHLVEHHMDAFIDGKMSRVLKRLGIPQFGKHMLDLSWRAGRADFYGRAPAWMELPQFRGEDSRLRAVYDKVAAYIHAIENPVFSTRDLAVKGNDVMSGLGIPPGPAVGKVLQYLLHQVQDGAIPNTHDALIAAMQTYHNTELQSV